jgi:hypothetical protein
MSGEKKYYLANLPAKTDLRTLATTIKARWVCEQAHQQMKKNLVLGPAAIRAASTGRTHDRTRPMLHQRKKALVNEAPSTHKTLKRHWASAGAPLGPLASRQMI